jgi:hypothetical protein
MLIAFGIYYFYNVYKASVEAKEAEEDRFFESLMNGSKKETNEESLPMAPLATKSLVMDVLKRIGCEPHEEEDGVIHFIYQGENFIIQAREEMAFICIFDVTWYSLPVSGDIEDFARLQKVINASNRDETYIVFYTIAKEEDEIVVHTKRNDLFVPQIPDIENYLRALLNGFFRVQRLVFTELERLKVADELKI